MILEMHNNFKDPIKLPATRVLITDNYGTPICMVVEYAPNHHRCFHVGDEGFQDELMMHGFDRTVIVSPVDLNKLKKPVIYTG